MSTIPGSSLATSAYLNWMQNSPENLRRAYGDNVDRLKSIKAQVDPDNLFRNFDLMQL